MQDRDCVAFLQWALPRLQRPWAGFRKVRRQLCRRIEQRWRALGLLDAAAYRGYFENHADEWDVLDALCPITLSCFYRDAATWEALAADVLPELARGADARGARTLQAASIGCASGEEPYTLMLAWRFAVAPQFPRLDLEVTATDVVEAVLVRARAGCYAQAKRTSRPAARSSSAGVRRCRRGRAT